MHSLKRIKAVIFDCDGTLVDSEQCHYLAWQTTLQKRGHFLEKEFYQRHFSGVGDREVSKIVTTVLGFDGVEGLQEHKNRFFEEYQTVGIVPITTTVEFVKRLFEHRERLGLKLAVASGARRDELLGHLKNFGLDHYFEVILSGRDDLAEYQDVEGTNKPKPYVYLKTARMLGVHPAECIAIEDSATGISSAVCAGCFTVAVPNEFTRIQDLSLAHMKIDSFADMDVDDFLKMIASTAL